jgi:IS5 family transposase
MLTAVNVDLSKRGLLQRHGTMVNATIIQASSSTKNGSGRREPDMHQARKGNQWFFGRKTHKIRIESP